MRINVQLVKALQFLYQFSKLEIRSKPGKKHIVPDALSHLTSANTNLLSLNSEYSELDVWFTYTTTLVNIHTDLIKRMIDGYKADKWWSKLLCQVEDNKAFGDDKTILFFVKGISMPMDFDLYFTFRPELPHLIFHKVSTLCNCEPPLLEYPKAGIQTAAPTDKKEVLYHVNKVTRLHYLCIPPSVMTEIITLIYGTSHPRLSRYFEIITCSWFIWGLTQMLWFYI